MCCFNEVKIQFNIADETFCFSEIATSSVVVVVVIK
jgi:hypothetical protein